MVNGEFVSGDEKSARGVSKADGKDPDNHASDPTPVDEECYDGSVVGGSIVWKACKE